MYNLMGQGRCKASINMARDMHCAGVQQSAEVDPAVRSSRRKSGSEERIPAGGVTRPSHSLAAETSASLEEERSDQTAHQESEADGLGSRRLLQQVVRLGGERAPSPPPAVNLGDTVTAGAASAHGIPMMEISSGLSVPVPAAEGVEIPAQGLALQAEGGGLSIPDMQSSGQPPAVDPPADFPLVPLFPATVVQAAAEHAASAGQQPASRVVQLAVHQRFCPPHGAKAICGRRARMEDAYTAVPFLLEVCLASCDQNSCVTNIGPGLSCTF